MRSRPPWPRPGGRWSPTRCTPTRPPPGAARRWRAGVHDDRVGRRGARRPAHAAGRAGSAAAAAARDRPDRAGYFGAGRCSRRPASRSRPQSGVTGPEETRRPPATSATRSSSRRSTRSTSRTLGGVIVGIADPAAWSRRCDDLIDRLAPSSVSVERMAPLARRRRADRRRSHRPALRAGREVGLGGIYTEVFEDVAVDLAPLDSLAAERLLRSLRGAPLLAGVRGRRAVRYRRGGPRRGRALAGGGSASRHRRDRDQPAPGHTRRGRSRSMPA